VSSGFGLGENYKSKKVSLRALVVLGGTGIHYQWIVKMLLILVKE
jgi:hypothetical protein